MKSASHGVTNLLRERRFLIRLLASEGAVEDLAAEGLEDGEAIAAGTVQTHAGGGDVDGLKFTLRFPNKPVAAITNMHSIWSYLLANADADTARRLKLDPGNRPDNRKLTILMDHQGTRGFSVTVDQLLTNKVLWVPDLDIFLSAGESQVSYSRHQSELAAWSGRRMLDRVEREPEASYEQFTRCWEDMGSPSYRNPAERPPGHIVCLSWDSSVRKFGIDRGAGVHSDLGNPDHFHFWFDFGELYSELARIVEGTEADRRIAGDHHSNRERRAWATRSSSSLIRWMVHHPSEAATCRWCCCKSSRSASSKESHEAYRSGSIMSLNSRQKAAT